MNWTTAGAASACSPNDATATPRAQKLAAPGSRVTRTAPQWLGKGKISLSSTVKLAPLTAVVAP